MSGAVPPSHVFEELAIPLFDQLYNFAHWLTQNRDEAEDLVQETYVKALKGFSSFQLGTNFRAWIYRILRNTFLTSRKGLKVTMTIPLDFDEEEGGRTMVCEPWKARLDTYLDGEVPEEEMRTFDSHVRNCTSCSADALSRVQ